MVGGEDKTYQIAFIGLKKGLTTFNYLIDDVFLSSFINNPYQRGKINVNLFFEKNDNLLELTFDTRGYIDIPCDICLEKLKLNIRGKYIVFIKLVAHVPAQNQHDEIVYIDSQSTHIDVKQFIYEAIVLHIPLKKTHIIESNGMSACNPEMLSRLYKTEKSKEVDPRWEGLMQFKKKP